MNKLDLDYQNLLKDIFWYNLSRSLKAPCFFKYTFVIFIKIFMIKAFETNLLSSLDKEMIKLMDEYNYIGLKYKYLISTWLEFFQIEF